MSSPVAPPSLQASSSPHEINFEDVCLDPYRSNLDNGRNEGHAAGLKAGYDEGRKLGQQKGLEAGIELGYMRGAATTIQTAVLPVMVQEAADDSNSIRRVEKIEKSINELIVAIDEFPSSDEIFNHEDVSASSAGVESDEVDNLHNDSEDIRKGAAASPEKTIRKSVDTSERMQRIRAKFKLICVHLKVPKLSLTKVMEDAKKSIAPTAATESSATSQDNGGLSIDGDQEW